MTIQGLHTSHHKKALDGIHSQLDLVQPAKEIVPGVVAIAVYGHTSGHMVIEVTSHSQQLLFAAMH